MPILSFIYWLLLIFQPLDIHLLAAIRAAKKKAKWTNVGLNLLILNACVCVCDVEKIYNKTIAGPLRPSPTQEVAVPLSKNAESCAYEDPVKRFST